jgi:hypothetical protein
MSFSKVTLVLKAFFDKRPIVSNCLNYGGMAGLAEFTQQTIERKIGSKIEVRFSKVYYCYC